MISPMERSRVRNAMADLAHPEADDAVRSVGDEMDICQIGIEII